MELTSFLDSVNCPSLSSAGRLYSHRQENQFSYYCRLCGFHWTKIHGIQCYCFMELEHELKKKLKMKHLYPQKSSKIIWLNAKSLIFLQEQSLLEITLATHYAHLVQICPPHECWQLAANHLAPRGPVSPASLANPETSQSSCTNC